MRISSKNRKCGPLSNKVYNIKDSSPFTGGSLLELNKMK
jgi:hypothetical protein